jgi:hypothetical protein
MHYLPIIFTVIAALMCTSAIIGYVKFEPPDLRPQISIPKNEWMNNATVLAQIGHFLGGYTIITTWAFHGGSWRAVVIVAGVVVVYAAVKEFFYDANYEIPHQTFWDNLLDFSFWCLGAAVGVLGVWIK